MPALPPPPPAAEIVVTGRGLDAIAGDAAYDVVTIDRDRLTSAASGRIEDVLRDVAGFQQFRRSDARSAHPTSQGATLRGLGGNASSRALIVLDGVPQIDPFGGWVTFTAFDPGRLSNVRVTRGGGTGAFGPGALAGTIELTSAGPGVLTPVMASLAYGSRNSIDGDATVSGKVGNGFALLSGNYQRGDGFIPIIARQRGPVDKAANYSQGSLTARAVFPIAPDTELQATMMYLRDARTRGLDHTDNKTTGTDASVRLIGRGSLGWEALAYLQMRDFSSGFASANATRTVVTQSLQQSVPATGIGGKIELRPHISDIVDLRVGIDGRHTVGETDELYSYVAGAPTRYREAGGETTTAGAFTDLSATLGTLTLTAGGRIDRWWIESGSLTERLLTATNFLTNTAYPDRHGTETTARGGAAWKPIEGVRIRAAGYLGWRLPTLNELYRPFRAGLDATASNPALNPERLKGVDGGIDWTPLPNVTLGATLFHNVLDHAIGNITLGVGPGTYPQVGVVAAGGVFRQRGNLDAVRSNGVELDAHASHGPFSASASYAYVDARVRSSGVALSLNGLRPAQTPRHQLSSTIGFDQDGLRGSATVRYVADQFEDDQNSRTLRHATTLDLTAGLPIAHGVSVEARAENVTNTLIPATLAADGTLERATPRTLWIGLRFAG